MMQKLAAMMDFGDEDFEDGDDVAETNIEDFET